MTDMEKKVMVRLCAKIVAETDLYETDKEVQNLIDWICLSEQIKENNNTIRNLTGEYKKIEPDCREGVRVQLERMKELCKERKDNNIPLVGAVHDFTCPQAGKNYMYFPIRKL